MDIRRIGVLALQWAVVAGLCSRVLADEAADAKPAFSPGAEARVELAGVGGGYILVYVPKDYDPARPHPLMVCYPGHRGKPTTSTFRKNLAGKTFILVAMGYFEPELVQRTNAQWRAYVDKEVASVRSVLNHLKPHLNIATDQCLIGGVSMGGWQSSAYAEASLDLWQGVVIIAAGRGDSGHAPVDPDGLRGKAIYIGVGEADTNNASGHAAAAFYRQLGADVTLEEYPGLGHAAKPDSAILREFLLRNGPLRGSDEKLARAAQAEKARRFGEAWQLFSQVAGAVPGHEVCLAAGQNAARLADQAEQMFADAAAALQADRRADAGRRYNALLKEYRDTPFAQRAQAALQDMRNSARTTATTPDAASGDKASVLASRARAADEAKDYVQAMELYESYVQTYAQGDDAAMIQDRLNTMKADPAIIARVHEQRAAVECREWLSMADNYLAADKADAARPLLQKIVENHPGTTWHDEAQKRLKKIGG